MSQSTTPENETPATSEQPVIHVQISADIPDGTTVHITIEAAGTQQQSISGQAPQGKISAVPVQWTSNQPVIAKAKNRTPDLHSILWIPIAAKSLAQWTQAQIALAKNKMPNLHRNLFWAAIVIYGLVVSIGIDRFPIYFFTDEAMIMNMVSDFIRDGFRYNGELLPTFFIREGWVNGVSVYIQIIPYLIFGKSVIVTRLISAFITLLGAVAVGLLLKQVFKIKYYWAGIFLLLTTPAWFLHIRTTFEYSEVAGFYCIFLYFYGRYRRGDLRSLYFAIFAGALCFYTHGLGEVLMGVTGLALVIVDFRYHIHRNRRKTVLLGLGMALILLLPFARYYLTHPAEIAEQVKRRGSYWANSGLPFQEKISNFLNQYVLGLNPWYWYSPNNNHIDMDRHRMLGYGNGLWFTFPFVLVGLFQIFKSIRKPASKLLLIALLVSPIPASIVAIGMPRILWMTVPLAILAAIGLSTILQWAEKRVKITSPWPAWALFAALTLLSTYMLRDALVNGPKWFQDYTLYGMQYGAKQIFQDVVRTGLEKDPNRRYVVSPSWANGTEQFIYFFVPPADQSRINLGQPVDLISTLKTDPPNLYFVTTSDEYDKLLNAPEYKDVKVEQILPLPNGKPGFYVITLKVSDNIDQIIAAKKLLRRKPVEDSFVWKDQTVRVIHSPLGGGQLNDIMDGNPDTLAKTLEANPFILDYYFQAPIPTSSVSVQTGTMPNFTITVRLYAPGSSEPIEYIQNFTDLPPDPEVTILFPKGPAMANHVSIEVKGDYTGDDAQIHIREIDFK